MSADASKDTAHITSDTPLGPAINAWKYYLNDQGSSPHTVKAFLGDMNLLASYLPPDRTIGSIATTDLNNFLDWMQNERGVPCSPKTLSRRITSIKAFFRWLQGNGVVLVDPAEKVVQKSVISPLPEVLTPDEKRAVLEAADRHRYGAEPDAREYTLLALLLETGIKKSECLALSPNHVDLEAPEGPLLFVRYANQKYRYKERKIPLSDSWVTAYQEYQQQYEISDQLFPWSPRRLEYILEDIGAEAGLDKHLSFLMCRWTCALDDYVGGKDHDKIRQKLGISKIQWREVGMKLRKLSKTVPN
ncbi:MAG: tyrosine-type recombinase/integrase [Anaerolineales bacterium]|nr:tyrosine-type recombinase/integrase [Anaerolineales bacterium]